MGHAKTNKRIFKIFNRRVAEPFWFVRTKLRGNIPTETLLTGVSNEGGVSRNRDSEPISGFIWMWALVCARMFDVFFLRSNKPKFN